MPAFRTSDSPGTNQIAAARARHEWHVGGRAFTPPPQWSIVRLAPERTVNERSTQDLTSPLPERALGSHIVIFPGQAAFGVLPALPPVECIPRGAR